MKPFKEFSPAMLKSVRHERGLKSQRAFSEFSGISEDTIKKLESGSLSNPGLQTLRRLGESLGVYFYAGYESEKDESK